MSSFDSRIGLIFVGVRSVELCFLGSSFQKLYVSRPPITLVLPATSFLLSSSIHQQVFSAQRFSFAVIPS